MRPDTRRMTASAPVPSTPDRPSERLALALFGAFFLLLASLPQIEGRWNSPEGFVPSGVLRAKLDVYSYFAKMRQGAEGAWLYENRFTPERSRPAPLFIFYLVLGKVSLATGLSIPATYQAARVACGGWMLWALAAFLARIGLRGSTCVVAFVLCVAGSGLAWITLPTGLDASPVERSYVDAYLFLGMLNYPHFAAAIALALSCMGATFQLARSGARPARALATLAAAAFALAWVHPRALAVPVAAGIGTAVVGLLRARRPLLPWIAAALVVAVASLGPGIAMLLAIRGDAVWESGAAEPTMTSPTPFELFGLGYGPLLAAACIGIARRLHDESREGDATRAGATPGELILAWAVAGAVLPYLPVASQSRLILAYGVPLGIGAAWAIAPSPGTRFAGAAGLARIALVIALCLGNGAVLAGEFREQAARGPLRYFSTDRMAAFEWLSRNARRDDVVLATFPSSIPVPGFSGNRVVAGHSHETPEVESRIREIEALLAGGLQGDDWIRFQERYRPRYLLLTEAERGLLPIGWTPDSARFRPRWSRGGVSILEIRELRSRAGPRG